MVSVAFEVRTLRRVLVAGAILFSLLGLAIELIAAAQGESDLGGFRLLLSLSEEGNLPTLYQSVVLLVAAGMLLAIGSAKRERGAPWAYHWSALGYIFFYMCLDEFASIHEQLNRFVPTKGVFYYSWIIPFGVLVAIFALSYLKFLFHLPRRTAILFAVAGVIYVGGAIGMELPLGVWTEQHGNENLGYALIDWVEETLEMIGGAIFLSAVAGIFQEQVGEVRIGSVR